MDNTGLLLINLGTPRGPSPPEVREYLSEFLMDPLVIDIPLPLRWMLVNALILPFRSKSSSKLYESIWSDRGSPLLFHSEDLLEKVAKRVKVPVSLAMRYGAPSMKKGFDELVGQGVNRIIAFPLYPQYSLAATESSICRLRKIVKDSGREIRVDFVPPFYREPAFIQSFVERGKPYLKESFDHVLFSFHGLPERQVKKTDRTGKYCLTVGDCCESAVAANSLCYRHHCFVTAHEMARGLGLQSDQYSIAFQSRLGRTPWIQPFSDVLYETLPKKGIRRLVVFSPSFVADCLETLEEIAIRGNRSFQENGGENITLVPSLNSEDQWVEAVISLASRAAGQSLT